MPNFQDFFFYNFDHLEFLRRHTVFVLLVAFTFGLAYQSFSVAHFYWNRAEIAEKYCENKDKPEMKCHGKCHLTKKLTKHIQTRTTDLASQIEPISFWLFGVEISKSVALLQISYERFLVFAHQQSMLGHYHGKLFVPPDLLSA